MKSAYEYLPFIYAIFGVAAIWLSNEPVGRGSGILLVTASLAIFKMRLDYRKERAERAEENLLKMRAVRKGRAEGAEESLLRTRMELKSYQVD
ncbi:hypothetical protein CCP3SC15_820014 [Gammaproteobacteria bacterium]